jgi:hypothetical protein
VADIATLGVRVTGSGIKETERGLRDLTAEGALAERQGNKIGEAWGRNMGRAILAGSALAASGIALVIKNTIEAEKVQAQLAARVKSTGGAAGLAVPELNRMSEALSRATTFDDEQIGGAQALLLTFTRIGKDVFPAATEAVLNLSTAMGTDLNSAALQVGKALNDPVLGVTALARAGVQFSDSQKAVIKDLVETGRVAEAQAIILRELETQMGGSARAARETLGGALQALKNAFGDVLEGDSGGEGIKGTTRALNDLVDILNDDATRQGFQSVVQGLASIAAAAAQAVAMLGNVGASVSQAFNSLEDKSFQGLIDEQMRLENLLAGVQGKSPLQLAVGVVRGQVSPFETEARATARLNAELAKVLKQQDEFLRRRNGQAQMQQTAQGFQSLVSTGAGAAQQESFNERVHETIERLNEEAAAFGLSKSALLEREKAQALSAATSQKERDALSASYDALIGKVRADEQATAASKGASAASRDAAEAERERQRIMEDGLSALDALTEGVRQQAADLAGPAAQAAKAYADELLDLIKLEQDMRAANLLTADSEAQLAMARDLANKSYQNRIKAISEQKTAAEQLIEDLEFENKLIGLGNLEREQEIALRYAGKDATDAQRAAIRDLIAEQDQARQVAEGMDVLRRNTQGLFQDLMDGSKSAKEAFSDFVDGILAGIAEIVARNLTESLFGAMGSTQTGAAGGGWASLFASFFGGGRASGGSVNGGKFYEVGEHNKPELLAIHGKQYLIPGNDGKVTPMGDSDGPSTTVVNQTIQVTGTVDRHSAHQLQREASMRLRRASAR